MAVPPGPVAAPLGASVTAPGATASNRTEARRPVPEAPMASAPRDIVMSIRPPLACCVNVALVPPVFMKLPSSTARTRRIAGSKVNVSVIVVIRVAPVIEIGTVYGPPPTRNVVPDGESTTCAEPIPGDTVGVSATGGCTGAGGGCTAGGVSTTGGGGTGGGVAAGGVGGGAATVPGIGVDPGGRVTTAVVVPAAGGAPAGGLSGGGAMSGGGPPPICRPAPAAPCEPM